MAKVYVSAVIPAAAAEVWEVIRDFNAIARWAPLVAESRIELNQPSDKVGCIRNFRTKDGGIIRERLLA
ncbi:MAG TPA: SRPBCC family protein, partial [Paracoccaceae bacterium]|nr:SRPBCC family protein [Paracoccaceae bacterium]